MIAIGFANVMFTLWDVFEENTRTVYKIEGILTKTGKYHIYDGRLVDQKEYDWRTREDKDFVDALELVKSSDSIDILVTTNARYTEQDRVVEYIMDTENPKIHLVFDEDHVKEMHYNGYSYYLPIVDGKAKRWKNKVVSISTTNYEIKYNSIYIKF